VPAQPHLQLRETETPRGVQRHEELEGCPVVELQTITVDPEKSGGDSDSDPFVAVHERMILREALPKSGRLLDQVLVVAAGRARDGGLKRPPIPEARCSAETRDQISRREGSLRRWDSESLSKAAQQFRVAVNELVDGRQKRSFRRFLLSSEKLYELPHSSLLLWC
jgi:hypothetical protein